MHDREAHQSRNYSVGRPLRPDVATGPPWQPDREHQSREVSAALVQKGRVEILAAEALWSGGLGGFQVSPALHIPSPASLEA